jgi:hypothetical protein
VTVEETEEKLGKNQSVSSSQVLYAEGSHGKAPLWERGLIRLQLALGFLKETRLTLLDWLVE